LNSAGLPHRLSSSGRVAILGTISRKCPAVLPAPVDKMTACQRCGFYPERCRFPPRTFSSFAAKIRCRRCNGRGPGVRDAVWSPVRYQFPLSGSLPDGGRAVLMPAERRARSRTKKAGSMASLPASLVAALRREAVRRSPLIVRLGTDSVNPFRQQIYKSFVSVAPKSQTAKRPDQA